MLGRARFVLGRAGSTLRIPRRAVIREFEIGYVYVVSQVDGDGEDGSVVERRRVGVRTVAFRPELLDVESGLESGERMRED